MALISKLMKLLPLLLLSITASLFLNVLSQGDTTSFTFDSKIQPTNLAYQGNVYIPTDYEYIRLASLWGAISHNDVGRVIYSNPIHFWDSTRRLQASFETTIKFVISNHPNQTTLADGIAFFIAPAESTIPSLSYGGNLGVFGFSGETPSLFAVEFDTYVNNEWDPTYQHIGIDINSRTSRNVTRLNYALGQEVTARIDYEATTRRISVVATSGSETRSISYVFDLKTVLPQFVRVGISGSTGEVASLQDIRSWEFTSTLVDDFILGNANVGSSVDDTTSFTFDSKVRPTNLTYEADVYVPTNYEYIRLASFMGARTYNTVGRVVYSNPIHFWDPTRRLQASFETTIKLVISNPGSTLGDGIAFFIAPANWTIPLWQSYGGNLGLFGQSGQSQSLFAVEFDTYVNSAWDPSFTHVGIDINSRSSRQVMSFNYALGEEVTARINYEATTRRISVVATTGSVSKSASYVFDLKTVLPEQVRVGISGATGDLAAYQDIYSWDFTSTLVDDFQNQEITYIREYV